jgi:hypothetical protein
LLAGRLYAIRRLALEAAPTATAADAEGG